MELRKIVFAAPMSVCLGMLTGAAGAAPAESGAFDPRQAYGFVVAYGNSIAATTFEAPDKQARTLEDARCYIGVLDQKQEYVQDETGAVFGDGEQRRYACQILLKQGGRQVSYGDFGCGGKHTIRFPDRPAAAPQDIPLSEYLGALRPCAQGLVAGEMSRTWQAYTRAEAMHHKGWDRDDGQDPGVDPISGRPYSKRKTFDSGYERLKDRLDRLGRIYLRLFGAPALREFSGALKAYSLGRSMTAFGVFEPTPWWREAEPPKARRKGP
ncbi:MAG TPA: hypothetical protein DCM05_12690 [Elusimicrobia bacterium]|nr:hypothetical protein [Elusimicrobiota bacterium]